MNTDLRLIICERKGTWAAGLRRHLPGELRLRETRSIGECQAELSQSPASMVLVEVTAARLASAVELLARVRRSFVLARAVAVAERGCEAYEELLREAGAVYFTTSPRECGLLARLAIRHAQSIPKPRLALAARVWGSLPWPEAAGD